MNSYRDLEIYRVAFDLADQIAEGYGRRRYKAEYIKFLIYSHSSCDEALSQLEMLIVLYPEMPQLITLSEEYSILGRKINSYIDYVDNNWRT